LEEREREGQIQVVQRRQKNLGYLELKMGEYSGLLLLVTMAAVVISPSSVTADVIKVPDIPVDCAAPDVCATLRFYDANDNLLDWTMGTEKVLKPVKNVAKVQQIGTGSYTVFKGKNHKSVSACLSGNHIIDLKTEAYYDATVVKSVRYEHAGCPSMAGVPLWLVGAVIGVVVLVAVVIFVVMLRKRRAALRGDPVPTKA